MAKISRRQAERGRDFVDDRRSSGGGRGGGSLGGGGGRRTPSGKAAGGGLAAIIIAILGLLFGGGALTGGGGDVVSTPNTTVSTGGGAFNVDGGALGSGSAASSGSPTDLLSCDVNVAECLGGFMADTDDYWSALFENAGRQYPSTRLVLYDGETETNGCGRGRAAAGPFYCGHPSDQKVYIDIGAMEGLQSSLGAAGDFAQAYIVAHEVGHHIQAVTGISDQVRQLQSQNPQARNDLSVRQELQADCLAGMWAGWADGQDRFDVRIEDGDIDEAIQAAEAVGDDSIQSRSGYVDPHTFTHGTSAQRSKWFRTGFTSGEFDSCDTFNIANP